MVLERVRKIAETGEIPADNPVANIMAQVKLSEEPQDKSLWGSLKNWADSKGGRMTLGGLGTALGVGLTGGDLKDALGYGIIGAGNTAKGIYNREKDENKLAQEYVKQQMYWQNAEKNRQQQQELWDKRIEAARADAQLDYERRLAELQGARDFQREMAKLNRDYALEDRAANQEFQKILADEAFERNKELLGLNQDFTRENWKNQERQNIDARMFNADLQRESWKNQAKQNAIARQATLDWNREQMENSNQQNEIERNFRSDLSDIAYQRAQNDWERNQNATLAAEERANNLYNQRLENQREYDRQLLEENKKYNQDLLADQRAYEDMVRRENADNELAKIYYKNSLKPQQSTFDKKVEENRAKAYSEQEEKLRNFKASLPLIEKNVQKLMELSDKATYTWAGNLYNEGRKQLGLSATEGAVARAEMENIIENNVLPQLRALLGAQFTEREGERVKQTIMDPSRTPEERKAQLRNYLATKYEEMAQAARNLQTYEKSDKDPLGIL